MQWTLGISYSEESENHELALRHSGIVPSGLLQHFSRSGFLLSPCWGSDCSPAPFVMRGWKEHLLRAALHLVLLIAMEMCWFVAGVDHDLTPGKQMFVWICSEDSTTDRCLLAWKKRKNLPNMTYLEQMLWSTCLWCPNLSTQAMCFCTSSLSNFSFYAIFSVHQSHWNSQR